MPQTCITCKHPQASEINRRLKTNATFEDISRWLDSLGTPITRQALARHMKTHLITAPERKTGRKPPSEDFLTAVRDIAHEKMEEGTLQVTLRDGLQAQKQLDDRLQRSADHDLMARIALALTGGYQPRELRVLDPEIEAIEAEFRPLLTAGD